MRKNIVPIIGAMFLAGMLGGVLYSAASPQPPPDANPSGIEFTPSPDHAVVENGVNVVSGYTLKLYAVMNPLTPLATVNLGKPSPTNNLITLTTALVEPRKTLGPGSYVAKVVAEGPGGSAESLATSPFSVAPRSPSPVPGQPRVIK